MARGPVSASVVKKLVEAGYHPTTVALTLGLEVGDVLNVLPATERKRFVADDESIAQAMRVLAWRTIEESLRILDEGTPQQKMAVLNKFGTQLSKIVGAQETDPLEEIREDFAKLMAEIRGGEPVVAEEPVDLDPAAS